MTVGVKVWCSGEEFSNDVFLLLLLSLYIAQVLPVIFLSYDLLINGFFILSSLYCDIR